MTRIPEYATGTLTARCPGCEWWTTHFTYSREFGLWSADYRQCADCGEETITEERTYRVPDHSG